MKFEKGQKFPFNQTRALYQEIKSSILSCEFSHLGFPCKQFDLWWMIFGLEIWFSERSKLMKVPTYIMSTIFYSSSYRKPFYKTMDTLKKLIGL